MVSVASSDPRLIRKDKNMKEVLALKSNEPIYGTANYDRKGSEAPKARKYTQSSWGTGESVS